MVADRLADAGARRRARRGGAATWRRSRSRCTSRTSPGRATSGRCDRDALHVVVPDGLDDPPRPSGGNVYDRRVCDGLRAAGWSVHEHAVPGRGRGRTRPRSRRWPPWPGLPDGALCWSTAWSPRPRRTCWSRRPAGCGWWCWCTCRSGRPRQRRGARAPPRAVVTTSGWTRCRCSSVTACPPSGCTSPSPGVDPRRARARARGRAAGCSASRPSPGQGPRRAAVGAGRGAATCPGAAPASARWTATRRTSRGCAARCERAGLADRVAFTGPLDRRRARRGVRRGGPAGAADPRGELRHGGHRGAGPRAAGASPPRSAGVPEALGRLPDGRRPGLLVPPDDPAALAVALRPLADATPALRSRLRRRPPGTVAPRWPAGRRPPAQVARVLSEVAA